MYEHIDAKEKRIVFSFQLLDKSLVNIIVRLGIVIEMPKEIKQKLSVMMILDPVVKISTNRDTIYPIILIF